MRLVLMPSLLQWAIAGMAVAGPGNAVPPRSAGEAATNLMAEAMLYEEAQGDLTAAIDLYHQILAQYEQQRVLAAQTIFHLAEAYRKQGRWPEATAQFSRLIREFPDQVELVRSAQQHLSLSADADRWNAAAAGMNTQSAAVLEANRGMLKAKIEAAKAELDEAKVQLQSTLADWDRIKALVRQSVVSAAELDQAETRAKQNEIRVRRKQAELEFAQQELELLRAIVGPQPLPSADPDHQNEPAATSSSIEEGTSHLDNSEKPANLGQP